MTKLTKELKLFRDVKKLTKILDNKLKCEGYHMIAKPKLFYKKLNIIKNKKFFKGIVVFGISLSLLIGNTLWANDGNLTEILPGVDAKNSLTIYSTVTPETIPAANFFGFSTINSSNPDSVTMIPGYAIVNLQTVYNFNKGVNRLYYTDVATLLDPASILFQNPSIKILEQNYFFDSSNKDRLLGKYLGQEITVEQNQTDKIISFTGTLLSASNNELILQTKDKQIMSISNYANIRFPNNENKLFTKPTLVWNIFSENSIELPIELNYQTAGITWWGEYNAVYTENPDNDTGILKLNANVSIMNGSGKNYQDTQLKLVAGNLNKAESNRRPMPMMMAAKANAPSSEADTGFSEKQNFEYYLYTLDRKVSIPNNTFMQLALYPSMTANVTKKYFYRGVSNNPFYGEINLNRNFGEKENKSVEVILKFVNDKSTGLGVPLPFGRIRVYNPEFIGEDKLNHTAIGEEITLKLGNAFDIVGSRKQKDFSVDNARRIVTETFEISINNHKDKDIVVTVIEPMNRSANWTITKSSLSYEKKDATTVYFPLTIPKNSETKMQYTVQYTW